MSGAILFEYHVPRYHPICKEFSMMQDSAVKGDYTDQNTIPGVIIANSPMDLVCVPLYKSRAFKRW